MELNFIVNCFLSFLKIWDKKVSVEDFRKNKNGIDQGNLCLQNDISERVCMEAWISREFHTQVLILVPAFIRKSLY